MANSGQPGGFFGENVGGVYSPSFMNPGTDCDPTDYFDWSVYLASPQNPTMETEFNSHQRGQPAERIHQISSSGQPSSDQTNINVPTTPSRRMTTEQREKRKEMNRKSRAKKKKEEKEMKDKVKKLEDETEKKKIENAELKRELDSMRERLESQTIEKDKLESDLKKVEQYVGLEELLARQIGPKLTLKDEDLKFIKEGVKHDMKPTQDQSPSDEESHSEKEISAGNLDGGESEDYNDYKKKKKRVARSAPSEGRSGKVRKFAHYDARADQRHGSTSNRTAMVRDPYSITECLCILNAMEDITYPIVKKAIAKFESPVVRETFVGLREDWRRDWVKGLEDDA